MDVQIGSAIILYRAAHPFALAILPYISLVGSSGTSFHPVGMVGDWRSVRVFHASIDKQLADLAEAAKLKLDRWIRSRFRS